MKNLQTMKHNVQKGFTLIELMIVVAIIGILAALAIPAYTDYTIKAKVSEAASLSGAVKTATEVYFSENGTLPDGSSVASSDLGVSDSYASKYVSAVSRNATAEIAVLLKTIPELGAASGDTVVYVPDSSNPGNIVWTVSGTIDAKYKPKT
ncbi:MAG: pilin [Cycloclasticus sp.]